MKWCGWCARTTGQGLEPVHVEKSVPPKTSGIHSQEKKNGYIPNILYISPLANFPQFSPPPGVASYLFNFLLLVTETSHFPPLRGCSPARIFREILAATTSESQISDSRFLLRTPSLRAGSRFQIEGCLMQAGYLSETSIQLENAPARPV
jgi:hypothetical protein